MKKNNINRNRLKNGACRLLAKMTLISAVAVGASLFVMSCGSGLSFSNKDDTRLTACSDVNLSRSSSLYSISMRITCSFGTNDIAAPITSALPASGVYGSTFAISFVSNELVSIYYTIDGSVPTTASAVYSAPFTIAATTTLRYFSVDTSGNVAQLRSIDYVVDETKISLIATSQESFFAGLGSNSVQETTSAKITWSSSTQRGLVVVKAGYGDITGAVEIGTFNYTGGSNVATINGSDLQPGLNNVFLYFKEAGYDAGYLQVEINKDGVYPNTVPSVDEGYYQTGINITLATNEGARTFFTIGNGALTQYTGSPINLSASAPIIFKFYSVDYAGNVEPVRTYTYVFDKNQPYFSGLNPPADPAIGSVLYVSTNTGSTTATINFTVEDFDTGVDYYQIEICADANCTAPGSGTTILHEAVSVGGLKIKAITEVINQTEVNEGRNWIFVYNIDLAGNFALYKFTLIKDSTVRIPVPIYPETGQYVKAGTINFAFTNTCLSETIVAGGSYEKFSELQVDNNADFSSPEVSNTITFTHTDPEACTGLTAKDPLNNYYISAVTAGLLSTGTTYYYRVRLTDKAGNTSPYSPSIPFYYDKAKNDINGDGYSDIVVGVPLFDQDGGGTDKDGKVYIYFGGSGAFMNTGANVTINSDISGSRDELFGTSVDFIENADGSGKVGLIVGAKDNQGALNGRVYIFFNVAGKCGSYPCTLSYTNADITISGIIGDNLGTVVKGLGDINNDGFSDFAISAPAHDPTSINNAGSVFIYFGKALASWAPPLAIDLSIDPSGGAEFKLSGMIANEKMGITISTLGDVNKDGYLDFMIGSPFNSPNSTIKAGTSYVVKGGNGSTVALDYTYNGSLTQELFGNRLSGGADLNNDGYSDFLVSSIQYSVGFSYEGQVSMFLGGNDNSAIDYYLPSAFPVTATGTIEGGVANVKLADSMASIPNLDGTNKAGFIACAIAYSNGANTSAGKCFLHTISGTAISANLNTNLIGTLTGQKFGGAVKFVGDVNGDGCGDFAISSLGTGSTNTGTGSVDVYFGRGATCYSLGGSVATIVSNGTMVGENTNDEFGTSLGGE